MASKLSKLRQGIPPHKMVLIRDMQVAVVILPSDIIRLCEEQMEEYAKKNPDKVNDNVKNQYFDRLLCYHCMRDPEDPSFETKLADSPEEVGQAMDLEDISRITGAYGELMMNKAPKIELLNEEEFENIKKFLEVTPLKGLNTVSLVHLANFHQTMDSGV